MNFCLDFLDLMFCGEILRFRVAGNIINAPIATVRGDMAKCAKTHRELLNRKALARARRFLVCFLAL